MTNYYKRNNLLDFLLNHLQLVVFVIPITVWACVAGTTGCTDQESSERALKAQGFDNIETTGYELLACSHGDWYHTGFKATNIKGDDVEGTVCCGLVFKNCTIRFK